MAYLDLGPPRPEYKANILFQIFNLIENALNHLDENNFPNQISGSIIANGTLSTATLKDYIPTNLIQDYSLSIKKLAWREIPIPLILAATPVTTTSTTGANFGGYFSWIPSAYSGDGTWYLEASIAIGDASATATCILKGSVEYASVTTQSTSLTVVRSSEITMPTVNENLWIVLKTSNSSYAASLASARLIYVP